MDRETKKCPQCAEEIKVEAVVCRFCGARFANTVRGYCAHCHDEVDLDANDKCSRCGGDVIDRHIESRVMEEPPPPVVAPPPPPPPPPSPAVVYKPAYVYPPTPPAQNLFATCGRIVFALLIVFGLIAFFVGVAPTLFAPPAPTSTPTRRPTSTPRPTLTRTSTRTRTPTPLPEEITFDTLDDVPDATLVKLRGRLVMFGSTSCSYTCGVLLGNPAKTSQVITIFISQAKQGDTPVRNQMKYLPSTYTKSDVQIRLDDGSYAIIGDIVMVTGRKCISTTGHSCIDTIQKIERWE